MTFDPTIIAEQFRLHGEDWADLNAAADLLEKNKDTIKANLVVHFLKTEKAVSKAEYMAEASPEYSEHLSLMIEARRKANRAKVQYDSDRVFIDMLRSVESTRRAELTVR